MRAMPFSRPVRCSLLAFAATAVLLATSAVPYGLQEGSAAAAPPVMPVSPYGHDRRGFARRPGDRPGRRGRAGQPFSAAAIDSAIGVVGRPISRDRSPLVTASWPCAMAASTSTRIAAKASGSPAPVRIAGARPRRERRCTRSPCRTASPPRRRTRRSSRRCRRSARTSCSRGPRRSAPPPRRPRSRRARPRRPGPRRRPGDDGAVLQDRGEVLGVVLVCTSRCAGRCTADRSRGSPAR